jgi:poly-gamma-glutamate capsule biosynthesis protein CapA/YwtB (metallophosphatase superfamily)
LINLNADLAKNKETCRLHLSNSTGMIKLFLAGDVMTGRGIDQILPHPCEPAIYENNLRSALEYVALAERAGGIIRRPAGFDYIWGAALGELSRRKPHVRIVNLETAITAARAPEPKGINYRMNPANIPVLAAAEIDCCVLSNNHVRDWGEAGLIDTLQTLKGAGILTAGAGRNLTEASQPAIVNVKPRRRVLVFGLGLQSSGIPGHWAAAADRAGVRLLPDLSKEAAEMLASEVLSQKQPGDIVALSVHWGSNWGYEVTSSQQAFAHAVIDLGACDILHGHSSHHARPVEIYKGKLILYGCGDFINDYEGIPGFEEFRNDLAAMYLPGVDEADGALSSLTIALFQIQLFSLHHASFHDVQWFQSVLNKISRGFGTRFLLNRDGTLSLDVQGA